MAEVNIDTIHSTIRSMDSQELLNPQVLERIVAAVLQRLADEKSRQKVRQANRELRQGVSTEEEDEE